LAWRPKAGRSFPISSCTPAATRRSCTGLQAKEFKQFRTTVGEERIFPGEPGAKRKRQKVDKSFETILTKAGIEDFRFHDLRHTFASWYMMNGGDLYELAKLLGHSNIKMTEWYAKLGKKLYRQDRQHRSGDVEIDGRRNEGRSRTRIVALPYCSPG